MSERAPLPQIPERLERGPVLLLAPHPDDDLLGAGGTCALHLDQGDPVKVVVVYDGAAGDPEGYYDASTYVELRHTESREGGAKLGFEDYEFWDYPEGHEPGPAEFEAGVERLARLVRDYRPASVYAPWIGEHHLDHHVLARVARAALERAGFDGLAWGFEVWTPLVPTRIVDVTAVYERKQAGLRCHRSQLRYRATDHFLWGINANRAMYLGDGVRYGEAFRPL